MIHSSLFFPGTLANRGCGRAESVAGHEYFCQLGKKNLGHAAVCPLRTRISEKNDISDNDIFTQKQEIREVFILRNGIKEI